MACVPSPSPASLPPLETLKHLNILSKLRGPELDTALKVWPHQCRVQGKNDLPAPVGHTTLDPGQDALGPLGPWAHCWLMFSCCHQCPQVPFLLGTVQPHRPQPITLQGVIVAKVQDSALGLNKLHPIGLCLSQVSLQSPPTFQQIDTCHTEAAMTLQPMKVHIRAEINLQPEYLHQIMWILKGGCDPWGRPCYARLQVGPVDPWRDEPTLEQVF
ncbi:hypothetical protein DUI87_10706 [Hirundo rustica rustica]|uniref:Uncharacterized protein n=1 Tax=Hirundo rustica rustica TaxID=333673 RepID=A0A3M0KJC1_HIRRU|nr:hypothetical protein DUI87_10706 [Hirundo rustica rustica]